MRDICDSKYNGRYARWMQTPAAAYTRSSWVHDNDDLIWQERFVFNCNWETQRKSYYITILVSHVFISHQLFLRFLSKISFVMETLHRSLHN